MRKSRKSGFEEGVNQLAKENVPNDWKSIYIMKRENGQIKIGVSKNVKKRKRSIENAGAMNITNLYKTDPCSNPYEIERLMHERFKDFRIRGEWFSCDMGIAISELEKMFKEKAIFQIKRIEGSPLDYFMETVSARIEETKEYVGSIDQYMAVMEYVSKEKNRQIERLIAMVEKLQSEIKIKNSELEKYYQLEERYFEDEYV